MTKTTSAFRENGLNSIFANIKAEIQELYLADSIPWVVGYSGGKDSTAVLQLIWLAIADLPPNKRNKTVHVISTDTLVENPVVASWVTHSLEVMKSAAISQQIPISPNRLTPATEDSFWVNLIGKGYPAPRPKFRWCTERLKIRPSNRFIQNVVQTSGEAILVLGTRKAESQARSRSITALEAGRIRERLSPNASLPGTLVYTPVEDWTNDDVWMFLMQIKNPWGYNNKELLTMYQGASADGECPLVVDSSSPSCGDSRFGCWVCTLVEKDKSMSAMIQNDGEKEWMMPLLQLRNELDVPDDRPLRDFRRMNGSVQLMAQGKVIPGPYTQEAREKWLRKLLQAQSWIRKNGPKNVRSLELITLAELQEIRRLWVIEKHEIEDNLPGIYAECMGVPYPGPNLDDNIVMGADEIKILRDLCGEDKLHFEMIRELIDIERRYRTMARRVGLFEEMEDAFKRSFYDNPEEALVRAGQKADEMKSALHVETPIS